MAVIDSFQSLLQAAAGETQPQRLLFVFARAVLPEDHDADQASRFHAGQGGALQPMMCVDKRLPELTTLDALAEEARDLGEEWDIVLVAALSGSGGRMPSDEEATHGLNTMIKTIHAGGDLSAFAAFDRNGEPVGFV